MYSFSDERTLQAGIVTFSTSIIKGGVEKFALKQPIFVVSLPFYLKKWHYIQEFPAIANRSNVLTEGMLLVSRRQN